jgi:hypothetical protein
VKQVVRIQGLVRLAERVRVEIGRGLSGGRKRELRDMVSGAIAQVDGVLKRRSARVAQLAAPSRRAYEFLAGIRWDDIAEDAAAAESPAPTGAVRWTGLTAFADRITARLSADVSAEKLSEIGRAVAQMSRRIEGSIGRQAMGPEHLTAATREWRGWLAWLATPESLQEYVTAIARANAALEPAARAAGNSKPLLIEFRPSRHIYKMRTRGGKSVITLPTPMTRFDAAGFADLAQLMFGHHRDAKRRVTERMRAEAYVDLATELEGLGGVVEGTRGAFHDLAESFERVNQKYFGGTMHRPRLTWSRTFTGRKFGHHDGVKDWVMVSSTLDRAEVPAFVVDYLMFHELLHKKHGIRWRNGRGHAHTPAFYADERRFERYDEADAWLTKLARR